MIDAEWAFRERRRGETLSEASTAENPYDQPDPKNTGEDERGTGEPSWGGTSSPNDQCGREDQGRHDHSGHDPIP